MNKMMAIFNALRYGASLPNPEVYKNRQNLINALVGLFGAIAIFLPIHITADDVANIAGGIAAVIGLLNVYTTTATSEKVGLQTDSGSEPLTLSPRPMPDSDSTISDLVNRN